MKLKADFVTNSSAASFVMRFKVKGDGVTDADTFRMILQDFLDLLKREYPQRTKYFWDGSNVEYNSTTKLFKVTEHTSMHNDHEDIPFYMKYLMVQSFIDGLKNLDFEIIDFDIVPD